MARERREEQPPFISRLGDLLGLSVKAVRRKLRWGRLLILVPAEAEQELGRPKSEDVRIIRVLQERVAALEQRLDRAEAERRQLMQDADAERAMLLNAIVEAKRSRWPGLWPWLRQLWLGAPGRSRRSGETRERPG